MNDLVSKITRELYQSLLKDELDYLIDEGFGGIDKLGVFEFDRRYQQLKKRFRLT